MNRLRLGYDGTPEHMASPGIQRSSMRLRQELQGRSDVELVRLEPVRRSRALRRHQIAQGLLRELWYVPLGMAVRARRRHVDALLCSAPFAPEAGGPPTVLWVHDVLALSNPELFPWYAQYYDGAVLGRRVRHARFAMVGTEHVREIVVETLRVPPERVRVVPFAVHPMFRPDPPDPAWLRERFGIDRPYALAVGTLEPRKNLAGALRGVRAAGLGDELALVVAGGRGWKNAEFDREAERPGIPLVRAGRLEDDELVRLYSGARCVVFPSLYEGYGLPVVEAMACGCPVVASDRSAIPEVAGGAALLADPLDPEAIGAAVRRVATDDALRGDLVARGLARVQPLNWPDIAGRVVAILREAAGHGRG